MTVSVYGVCVVLLSLLVPVLSETALSHDDCRVLCKHVVQWHDPERQKGCNRGVGGGVTGCNGGVGGV